VAQRVGRGIALLFHDRGTRRMREVSSTPRPHFTPGKDPVPILQKAGWAPGPAWKGGNLVSTGDSIPDRPARSQLLYRLSYPAHTHTIYNIKRKSHTKHNYQVWIYYRIRGLDIRTQTVCHSDSVLTAKTHEIYFKLSSVVEAIANTYCQEQKRCLRVFNYLVKVSENYEIIKRDRISIITTTTVIKAIQTAAV